MPDKFDCLIIGYGDIGKRIAQQAGNTFRHIHTISRRPHNPAQPNIQPIIADLDQQNTRFTPPDWQAGTSIIFYLAPPPAQGTTDPRIHNLLNTLPAPPRKLIYISTSSIYGDQQGAWVNENTPPHPTTDRARRRHHAEQQLTAWQHQTHTPITILRVPGIYGPGRLPLDKIRQGEPVIHPDQSPYTNLIHADDLARICLTAAHHPHDGTYNISDGNPIKNTDYYYTLADIAGLPRPPSISLQQAQTHLGTTRLSFINESRRLDIQKMLTELKPELQYTHLASGIRHALAASNNPT